MIKQNIQRHVPLQWDKKLRKWIGSQTQITVEKAFQMSNPNLTKENHSPGAKSEEESEQIISLNSNRPKSST